MYPGIDIFMHFATVIVQILAFKKLGRHCHFFIELLIFNLVSNSIWRYGDTAYLEHFNAKIDCAKHFESGFIYSLFW